MNRRVAVEDRDLGDVKWLGWICLSRIGFATIFTSYSAALPLLRDDWGMTASQAGLIQSAWHVGYLISLFAVGFMSDRFGAKRTFLLSSVAASVSALVFAVFADGFLSCLLLYGLTGLLSGGSYTPGLTIVAERFTTRGRGRAMGCYLAAASFGYALSLFMSSGLLPLFGWRGSFLVTACGPAIGTLIAAWVLRGTPNIVHGPPPEEFRSRGSLGQVLRNKPAMLSIMAYTFHAWEVLGMWAWLPAFLAAAIAGQSGMTVQTVSLGVTLSAVSYLVSVGGSIFSGTLSDRWGRTAVMLGMTLVSLTCSFTFGWMIGLPVTLLLIVAVIYNFSASGDSSVYSVALTELTPPRYLGAAYSIRSVLGFGAGAVSPWVFGLVLDWVRTGLAYSETVAWGLAWTSLGIGALLGPLMILKLSNMPESARMAGGRK